MTLKVRSNSRRYHGPQAVFSSDCTKKHPDFLEFCDILLDLREYHSMKDRWLLRWYGFFMDRSALTFKRVKKARLVKRLGTTRYRSHCTIKHLIEALLSQFYPHGTHDNVLDYYSSLTLPRPLLSKELPVVFDRQIKVARNLRFILNGDTSGFRACLRRMIGSIVTFDPSFDAYSFKYSEENLVTHLPSLVRQYVENRQYKPLEQVEFFPRQSVGVDLPSAGVLAADGRSQPGAYQYERHFRHGSNQKSGTKEPRRC